jgi:hypothetical protein
MMIIYPSFAYIKKQNIPLNFAIYGVQQVYVNKYIS